MGSLLARLEITRKTVIELLTGGDLDQEAAATAQGPASAVRVPLFTPNGDGAGAGQGLPVAYRDVVEVLADAGEPLRASQVRQALGTVASRGTGRGCAPGWKRLAGRGWLVEGEPGLFALAEGWRRVGRRSGDPQGSR